MQESLDSGAPERRVVWQFGVGSSAERTFQIPPPLSGGFFVEVSREPTLGSVDVASTVHVEMKGGLYQALL